MPKMTKVFGPERTNLMYSMIGYVMKEGYASVKEIADRFGYTEVEIREAAKSIGVAEAGSNDEYFATPFELNYEALEDDDIVEFIGYSIDMDTPRITTKQTAAISAGLKVLEQIPGFEYKDELAQLLEALHAGAGSMEADTIQVTPGRIDTDLLAIREAILRGKAISCDYRNGKGEVTKGRIIEPLRLESRDQIWYLRGYCVSKAKEVRVFKLDAMDAAVVTDQDIDPSHKLLQLGTDLYEPGANSVSVLLEVDPEAYEVLSDYKANFTEAKQGTVKAEILVTNLSTLPPMVASYGGAVRVVAPAEARALVREFALGALGALPTPEGLE